MKLESYFESYLVMHSWRSGDQAVEEAWGREQVTLVGEDLGPGVAADHTVAQYPGESSAQVVQDSELQQQLWFQEAVTRDAAVRQARHWGGALEVQRQCERSVHSHKEPACEVWEEVRH